MKKIKFLKKIGLAAVAALAVAVTSLLFTLETNAEGGASMFVSPMSQKIILEPGETYTGAITVTNGNSATKNLEYIAKVAPYSSIKSENDDYGGADVETLSEYNIMKDWIKIDKAEGSVEPNGRDTITFTIKTPKDAPAGAQYASIVVSEKDDDANGASGNASSTSSSIKSKFQLASVIYANVAGETVEKGQITENNIPSILTSSKLEATSMVRNEGNIYTNANYTLQVWPMFSDEEICTNEESTESSLVLPNTERYHVQTCDLPAVGIFRVKQVVSIFGEESVLEKTIIVCPIWLMILILVIIIAIIVAVVIVIKKNKAKKAED